MIELVRKYYAENVNTRELRMQNWIIIDWEVKLVMEFFLFVGEILQEYYLIVNLEHLLATLYASGNL